MKARLTLLVSVIVLNCLSCTQDNEMDKAIDEAMREADFDTGREETVSIRYFEEEKAR